MLQEGLNFTLVTGDASHKQFIAKGLSQLSIKNNFNHFECCPTLMNYLNSVHSRFYHIIMLDLDNPDQVGMACLKEIRYNKDFANKIIIAYDREGNADKREQFFIVGGNIFFTYPKTQKEFDTILKKLMIINWQIYSTGIDRQHFMLRL